VFTEHSYLFSLTYRQKGEAERVEMMGKKALETANEALRLAMETLEAPQNIRADIQQLRNK